MGAATVGLVPRRLLRTVVPVAAVAVVLSGCTFAAAEPDATAPAPAHLDAALERLPDRIGELLEETGVPGLSVAVVHDGDVVFADGYGVADLDSGAKVDADTVFQLASVSKSVGATVISALIGRTEGLSWQTPVTSQLPWFALGDEWVTRHLQLGDLYSHRSGLPDHAGDDLASFGVDQRTVLERLRHLPLAPFRDHYAYTNFGIQAGAMTAAAAAGGEWIDLSREVLYEPLGMDRTTSRYAEYIAMDNHAVGHTKADGAWRVTPEQLDDDIATAAGGVASSADDMAIFLRLLLDGGRHEGRALVDEAALTEAMSAQMLIPSHPADVAVPKGAYGRGFQVGVLTGTGDALVSHSGAFAQGAGTIISMVPAMGLGIVVLTNGYPIGLAETVAMETLDWAAHGSLSRDWWKAFSDAFADVTAPFPSKVIKDAPASAAPAGPAADYVGAYRSDYFGEATVREAGDHLELTIRPTPDTGQTWRLEPYDGDVFRVLLDNEDATPDSVSAVEFDPARGTFTFEFFDASSGGAGTFTRAP